jgi:FAD/FMN-containing dehydrogenase
VSGVAATVGPRPFRPELHAFAEEIGAVGPVTVVGGRTAWASGGPVEPAAREVRAPAGIVELVPAEMTVRVGAGTAVTELDAALAEVGQEVALGGRPGGTVGGAVSVGWSSLRRSRVGPARDVLLEAAAVGADGRLVRAGGPTVKNVTGYDLCRLLFGSLGTLLVVGEVLLRTRPRPAASVWVRVDGGGPAPTLRPATHLWDGTTHWLLLEGHPGDVHPAATTLERAGATLVDGPPELPPHRWSLDPAALRSVLPRTGGPFVAEMGVGTVHHSREQPPRAVTPGVRALHERMSALFDPTRRLNPGRDVLA